jgi:hypothetical protein
MSKPRGLGGGLRGLGGLGGVGGFWVGTPGFEELLACLGDHGLCILSCTIANILTNETKDTRRKMVVGEIRVLKVCAAKFGHDVEGDSQLRFPSAAF